MVTVPMRIASPSASCRGPSSRRSRDERAVLASQVLQRGGLTGYDDSRVVPRDAVDVDGSDTVLRTPEEVLAVLEGDLAASPDQLQDVIRGNASRIRFALVGERTREGVPEPVHGPYEARLLGVVPDGMPHLVHEPREAAFGNEGLRPEDLVQLFLRHGLRPLLEEGAEKLKRLRGDRDPLPAAEKLPRLRIEGAVAEARGHDDS